MEKKTNVPKLRFPEFEGEWVTSKLESVIIEGRLGGNYENSESNNGFPVIKMGNLGRGDINLNKVQYLPNEEPYNEEDVLKEGDLLFNTRNTLELVGKVSLWRNELPFALYNSNLMRMKFNNQFENSNRFLNLLFNTKKSVNQLRSFATGTTSVAAIYSRDLNKLRLTYPDVPEQTKIASFLTAVDDKLTQLKKKKSLLEEYKKGVMQKIFSQELRFKDDNGEDFPEWEEKRLGDIARLQGGYAFKSELFKSNGIPVIRISNISNKDNYIDLENIVFYQKNSSLENFTINSGDLIIAMSGATTGKSSIYNLPYKAYQNQRVGLFKTKTDSLYYPFLIQFVFSESFQKQLDSVLVAGAQPNVSSSDIESFIINLPYKLEQTKIANFLSAIDEKINHCSKQIERMEDWKKGLLQQMFC